MLLHGQHYMLTNLDHILHRVNICGCELLGIEPDLDDDLRPTVLHLTNLRTVSLGLGEGFLSIRNGTECLR